MFKIVNVFVATLALQAVLANPVNNQQHNNNQLAQGLLQEIRSVGNDVSNSIQNLQVGNQQGRHVLVSEADELAHHVHQLVYHLQQIILHNENGQGQQVLQQVLNSLNDVVHSIQQALQNEPTQLQSQLRTQIQNVIAQAERLVAVAQQQQQSEEINDEVLVVLDDLVVAVQQVHIRNRLQSQNQQQIRNHIQTVVNEVSGVVQNNNSNVADAAHDLAHHAHHLAHHLDEIVHDLQVEVHLQQGEVQNIIRQVINKLREIRVSLEQAQQDSSVNELRNQLKTNIHNIGAQIERLVQVVQPDNVGEQEARNFRDVVHRVLAHSLAAARQLQRNVANLVEDSQEN